MSSNENFKIVLVGESNVGKTCVISRYISGVFDSDSPPTNGALFNKKEIELAVNQ